MLPPAQGLYHPSNEHDACGVGFVANIKGRKSHSIVEQGLNVRQVEAIAQERATTAGKIRKAVQRGAKDADTLALEKRLSDALGLVVTIAHRGKGGEMKIRYQSLEQLDEVIRRIEAN